MILPVTVKIIMTAEVKKIRLLLLHQDQAFYFTPKGLGTVFNLVWVCNLKSF